VSPPGSPASVCVVALKPNQFGGGERSGVATLQVIESHCSGLMMAVFGSKNQ
jgi:hypothetical protein